MGIILKADWISVLVMEQPGQCSRARETVRIYWRVKYSMGIKVFKLSEDPLGYDR